MINRNFSDWWYQPITRKDRWVGAIIGALGSFWLCVIGYAIASYIPKSLFEFTIFLLVPVLVVCMFGYLYPKIVTIIFYPFSIFGIGS